jgi:hypothetical protein
VSGEWAVCVKYAWDVCVCACVYVVERVRTRSYRLVRTKGGAWGEPAHSIVAHGPLGEPVCPCFIKELQPTGALQLRKNKISVESLDWPPLPSLSRFVFCFLSSCSEF